MMRTVALAATASALAAGASPTAANGFQRFSLSAAGLGMANALAADAEHVSSMAYNPSALAFQEGTHFEAGFVRRYGELDSPVGESGPNTRTFPHDLFATHRGPAARWGAGLGVTRPFRMDSNWKGDFTEDGAATRTELDLIDVNPVLAVKLRPDIAVSLGADYYRALDFRYSSVDSSAPGNEIRRSGDGDGWGGTAGIMFWRESWSLAASYKLGTDLEMEGDNLDGNRFHLPARARVGLKWRPSLRWSVHLGAIRTSWSNYDGLEGVDAEKDWRDTMGYRLGAVARLSDKVALRMGYAFDEGPKDERTFDPRSFSGRRHLVTLGAGWEGDLLRFNLGYGYAFTKTTHVNGATVSEYDGRHRPTAQYLMLSVGYSHW
jgi:long-chain fatty acid transport protein